MNDSVRSPRGVRFSLPIIDGLVDWFVKGIIMPDQLPAHLRAFDDPEATRNLIYSNVLESVQKRFPVEDDTYRLELQNARYTGPQTFSLQQQKDALNKDRNLNTPITGTWRLVHKPTNSVVEEREDVVMHVPYYSDRGTFVRGANEYSVVNQARLRPGVYVRKQRTGDIEAHFNIRPGTGRAFRMHLEPETGVFKIGIGQSNIPAYPLLKASGVTDKQLNEAWGPQLVSRNASAKAAGAVDKFYQRMAGYKADPAATDEQKSRYLQDELPKFEIDDTVVGRTLGLNAKGITPEVLLRASQKMLHVSRGEEQPDDRDSPMFSHVYGVEDLLQERVEKDSGKLAQNLLRRAKRSHSLKSVQRGALNGYVEHLMLGSGLAQPLEETNTLSTLEQMNRITKLGEGGIGSAEAVTEEARDVNPGQVGFIDIISGPESSGIGIDVRAAHRTFKGKDKQMYGEFMNPATGKMEYLTPADTFDRTVAFPGELAKDKPTVKAMRSGSVVDVPRKEVDFAIPSLAHMFSSHINMNPMPTGTQGGRQFYGSKFWSQYMPLKEGEVPLVDSLMDDGKTTFSEYYGRKVGTIKAPVDGTVVGVEDNRVRVKDADGETHDVELVKDLPFNRLTSASYFPAVEIGQEVKKGDMVAHSNFTDKKTGAIALGRNLKCLVSPRRGLSFEDAYNISETAAQKLATERLLGYDLEAKHGIELGRGKFISAFPRKYTKDQIDNLDEDGIVKPGTVLQKGDPIVLAIGPKMLTAEDAQLGRLHKVLRNARTDKSQVWEYAWPGTVTDAHTVRGNAKVNVKSTPPVAAGDKLSSSYGLKGIVGEITPDDKMPRDPATNEPYEVVFNPMTIPSRVAPNQIIDIALAKLAKRTGKQVRLPQLPPEEGWAKWAQKQLQDAGVEEATDVFDPESGKTIRNVGDGYIHLHSFHHLAEKKLSQRGDVGGYTSDFQPSRGGSSGSKRFSSLDCTAALSHGATAVIKDVQTIRGTKNEEYWKALRSGKPLPEPGVPFIYTKFLNTLRAGGINVREKGDVTQILPMTDKDVETLSRGELEHSGTVNDDFEPVKGGMFDVGKTGGTSGDKWNHIQLKEPIPNPVMEEPVRRILGLKTQQLEDILAGAEQLNGKTGGAALQDALKKVDIDAMITEHKHKVRTLRGAGRDNSVKILGFLSSAKEQGIHPSQWMISKVPVLPPKFRPVSRMGDVALSADLNELYRDVIESSKTYNDLKADLPDSALATERLNIYNAVKAAYGLGDPITPEGQSKRLKGAIHQILGDSPKCYDDATELLTKDGWKAFPAVDSAVDVGTINPETGKFEWQRPEDVIHSRYIGIMVHTLTGKLDLLVTPNHKHYVEYRKGGFNTKLVGDSQWADPVKLDAAALVGVTKRVRFFTAAPTPQVGTVPAPDTVLGSIFDPDAFATYLGLWIAEGWLSRDATQVHVCQSINNPDNALWIDALMSRLGLPYVKKLYGDIYWWTITDKLLAQWIEVNCGSGAENKFLSATIKNWDSQYLRNLIEGYMRGDGEKRTVNPEPATNQTYYNRDKVTNYGNRASTVSPALVDSFAEVGVRIGLGFSLTDVFEHPDKPQWLTQYRFRIHGWNRVILEYPKQHSWEQYDGHVHCVTVPNGLLVVRRNGKTAVSGNSGLYQSKVISKPVDVVGRGVIAPDQNLDMDQMGIPADSAWVLYKDFVMRRLVQRGYPAVRAAEMIQQRDPHALHELEGEMSVRPVIADRAPTWHKFNLMAFYPHIVEGHTVRMSPITAKGFNADYDGDCHINTVFFAIDVRKIKASSIKNLLHNRLDSGILDLMNNKHQIPILDENHQVYIADLADFPHGDMANSKEGANGLIEFFDALPGTKVIAFDEVTNKPVWADVAYVSRHPDRMVEVVTLNSGHQIFTDDDPRAVYGIDPATNEYVRCTPSEAEARKIVVPYLRDGTTIFGSDHPRATLAFSDVLGSPLNDVPLNWDTGFMMGALCGDGWWDKRNYGASQRRVYISDLAGEVAARVHTVLENITHTTAGHCTETRTKAEDPSRYGDSVKHTFSSVYGDELAAFLQACLGGDPDERTTGSANKHLPGWSFTAPEACRRGMLCGLIDTDGTCCVTHGKDKPQLTIAFTSTSMRLCRDVAFLARTLGIEASVGFSKMTVRDNPAWLVTFSSVDSKRTDVFSQLVNPNKRDNFVNTPVDMINTHGGCHKVVFPDAVSGLIAKWMPAPKVNCKDVTDEATTETRRNQLSLYQGVYKGVRDKTITRNVARRVIAELERMTVEAEDARLAAIKWLGDSQGTCTPHQVERVRRGIYAVAPAAGDRVLYKDAVRYLGRLLIPLRTGKLSRKSADAIRTFLEENEVGIAGVLPALQDWIVRILDNEAMSWGTVAKIEKTGKREDGYDLTVPGYETFMAVDGVVLSNTMNFHVPASDKAAEQAKEKMLPSRNLFSLTDLKSVRYSPTMEVTLGLHQLSGTPNAKPVRTFLTQKAAKEAYRNGEITANDPIEVLELK